MFSISSENNEMFNIFETKHFNFSFQDVLLGEIKCFGFTQNHFFKKKSLLKNKEHVFLVNLPFFSPVVIHSQKFPACVRVKKKISKLGVTRMVLQPTTTSKASYFTPSKVHPF